MTGLKEKIYKTSSGLKSVIQKWRTHFAPLDSTQRTKKSRILPILFLTLLSIQWAERANGGDYCFPVQPVEKKSFAHGGHGYPAIDIFGKANSSFVAPTDGTIEDIQKTDDWTAGQHNDATKGGRWVSLLGDDGFRYYGSHLERVADHLAVGTHVPCGTLLGFLGHSGNAEHTPIHLHFGISPASSSYSWRTRRGEIDPYPFLQCLMTEGCRPMQLLKATSIRQDE